MRGMNRVRMSSHADTLGESAKGLTSDQPHNSMLFVFLQSGAILKLSNVEIWIGFVKA